MQARDGGDGVETDDAAFRTWVAARREPLRRSAFLMCGDWYLADDLVQDTMARLYSVWPRVVRKGDPEAYARRILVRLVVDHRRHRSRREVPYATVPDTEAGYGTDDALPELAAALAGLAPRQRATVVLRFWEDLSVAETASILGCSPGTVKSTTSKALAHLRTALEPIRLSTPSEESW